MTKRARKPATSVAHVPDVHDATRQGGVQLVSPEAYEALPENGEVRLALELFEAAQVRQEAVRFADAGQIETSPGIS